MIGATRLEALRAQVRDWKRDDLRIGLVPTMGNLHAGHRSLVRLARTQADRVVASVFVNPTQFGPGEDFERYPRTPEADLEGLREAGCDLAWMPEVDTMYPFGPDATVQVHVPGVTDSLEGAHRPGHFDGVATVVVRLFNQVGPDLAVFGRKDYQQLAVIQRLVRDLFLPVRIVPCSTVREEDGLAASSRNRYLDSSWRARAAAIPRALSLAHATFSSGERLAGNLRALVRAELEEQGLEIDYVELADPNELEVFEDAAQVPARVLLALAALAGGTRLIDNLVLGEEPAPIGSLRGALLTSGGAA